MENEKMFSFENSEHFDHVRVNNFTHQWDQLDSQVTMNSFRKV